MNTHAYSDDSLGREEGESELTLGRIPVHEDVHPDAYALRIDGHGAGLRAPAGSYAIVEPVAPTGPGLAVFYREGRPPVLWDLPGAFDPRDLQVSSASTLTPMIPVCDPVTGRRGFIDSAGLEKVHRIHSVHVPDDLAAAGVRVSDELRTLDACPEGMGEHRVDDAAAYPVVRNGETVVYDPARRDLRHGALCVIQWNGGSRSVMMTNRRPLGGGNAKWWVDPVNRPRQLDLIKARAAPGYLPVLYASDGPYESEHLAEKIVGEVVGILRRP